MVKIFAVLSLAITLILPSFADTIVANGAGPLPASAQDISGDLSASIQIYGTLAFPDGVDAFKLDITNPLDFSAYTVPVGAFGVPIPELFLFNASGFGVYGNDGVIPSGQACLPSADMLNPCPFSRGGLGPLTAGIYYLAITRLANSPLSNSGDIFSPPLSADLLGPDLTAGGGDPIVGWDNGVFTGPNFDLTQFDIQINDAPEPVTLPLLAAGLIGLVLFRKKLQIH